MIASAPLFEEMYRESDDPWGFRTRWYEKRKRLITLASLPRARFARAWEMGCSNGELGAELAERCDAYLGTEGSARAVEAAQERLHGFSHASVELQWHPAQWPAGAFDLIVMSEIGYYLSPTALAETIQKFKQLLTEDGVLVACHWRPPIPESALTGDEVHRLLQEQLGWPQVAEHVEADFVLTVWSRDGSSVATQEALR